MLQRSWTKTYQSVCFLHLPSGQIHQREQEIAELKQKIAEVMAVMPSLSYSSDGGNLSPVTPHYSSKFMDNSPSSLDPNASVYQPLKKWLWLCQTGLCLFLYLGEALGFWVRFEFTGPDSFLHCNVPHNVTLTHTHSAHNPSIHVYLAPFFGSIMRTIALRGLCTTNILVFRFLLSFGI